MPRDAGLVDPGLADNIFDRFLAVAQRLDDKAARWIGERLQDIYMHVSVYV
jgi:hypothetical protein